MLAWHFQGPKFDLWYWRKRWGNNTHWLFLRGFASCLQDRWEKTAQQFRVGKMFGCLVWVDKERLESAALGGAWEDPGRADAGAWGLKD